MAFIPVGASTPTPWAVSLTGDPAFPHNGKSTTDITVSTAETWGLPGSGADREFAGRIVQLRNLTLDDDVRLDGGPWFIFASLIDGDGDLVADGPSGENPPATFSTAYTRGGNASNDTLVAQAGCGGSILIVVADELDCSSSTFSANGGNGARNTTGSGTTTGARGEGALSTTPTASLTSGTAVNERFGGQGVTIATQNTVSVSSGLLHVFMANGRGDSDFSQRSTGGGAGYMSSTSGGAGSGIGAGGACTSSNGAPGDARTIEPTPAAIVQLALGGCKGGGAGGAIAVNGTPTNNGAGGGGGGAVVAYTKNLTGGPTLEANGGTGVGPSTAPHGSAGFVAIVEVP